MGENIIVSPPKYRSSALSIIKSSGYNSAVPLSIAKGNVGKEIDYIEMNELKKY